MIIVRCPRAELPSDHVPILRLTSRIVDSSPGSILPVLSSSHRSPVPQYSGTGPLYTVLHRVEIPAQLSMRLCDDPLAFSQQMSSKALSEPSDNPVGRSYAHPMGGVRRSGRIKKEVPILLVGTDTSGRVFSEETLRVVLSRHGAGIISTQRLAPDEILTLPLLDTSKEAEVRLVGQMAQEARGYTYGVTFVDATLDFWQIEFPLPSPGRLISITPWSVGVVSVRRVNLFIRARSRRTSTLLLREFCEIVRAAGRLRSGGAPPVSASRNQPHPSHHSILRGKNRIDSTLHSPNSSAGAAENFAEATVLLEPTPAVLPTDLPAAYATRAPWDHTTNRRSSVRTASPLPRAYVMLIRPPKSSNATTSQEGAYPSAAGSPTRSMP